MDIGRLLIFIPFALYSFYSFRKSKLNIYLIIGAISWQAAFYSGKHNVYQFIRYPFKEIINMISIFLLLIMIFPYLKNHLLNTKNIRNQFKHKYNFTQCVLM